MVSGCTSGLVKLWSVTTSQFNEIGFIHNAISTFIGRFGQAPVASQQQRTIQTVPFPFGKRGWNHGIDAAASSTTGASRQSY